MADSHVRREADRTGGFHRTRSCGRLSNELDPTRLQSVEMLKDCHLIEAARATDRNVVSIDETVRQYFHTAARSVGPLREVRWVNPTLTDEQPARLAPRHGCATHSTATDSSVRRPGMVNDVPE